MKRYLTIIIITITLVVVAPSWAQTINWTGGVSVTETTDAAGLSSTINAKRFNRPIGGSSTKMGVQFVITAHSSMTYECTLKTVGIDQSKIVDAILTPDGGKTSWVPIFVPGKGFTMILPVGTAMVNTRCRVLLPKRRPKDKDVWEEQTMLIPVTALAAGEMASLEWKLAVRDKKNTIRIIIIPITWTSERRLAMGTDVMVQQAMPDFDRIPNTVGGDHLAFAYLRGFIPGWASPDPATLAALQMQSAEQGAGQSDGRLREEVHPEPESRREEVRRPVREGRDGTVKVEITGNGKRTEVVEQQVMKVCIHFWSKDGKTRLTWSDQVVPKAWVDELCREAQCVNITRCGEIVATGEAKAITGGIEIHLYRGELPQPGDSIEIVEED